jgi:hypothetical protein
MAEKTQKEIIMEWVADQSSSVNLAVLGPMLDKLMSSDNLDTSDATATAGDIVSGKTAYVNGSLVTGSITEKSAQEYIPSTSDQTIAANQYLSGIQTIKGDENLLAENIKSGVTIFGVVGTYTGAVD